MSGLISGTLAGELETVGVEVWHIPTGKLRWFNIRPLFKQRWGRLNPLIVFEFDPWRGKRCTLTGSVPPAPPDFCSLEELRGGERFGRVGEEGS